jgi:formate dehydrogenase assembly factor FdhD
VLWYLNPQLDPDSFNDLAEHICNKISGFVTFTINKQSLNNIIYEVSMLDLEQPPKNKLRKIIFRDGSGLSTREKMVIVGKLIGRSSRVDEESIYQCMLDLHDDSKKITITRLAGLLDCSSRTIHRNMSYELKKEKELLNQQL